MSIFLREPIYSYEDPEEAHFVVQLEDTIIQTVGLSHEYILALTELDHVLLVNVQDYGTFKSNPGNFTNDLKYPGGSSKRSISSGYTHFVVYTYNEETLFDVIGAEADTIPSTRHHFKFGFILKISFWPRTTRCYNEKEGIDYWGK